MGRLEKGMAEREGRRGERLRNHCNVGRDYLFVLTVEPFVRIRTIQSSIVEF